jgi:NTE family protein
MSIDALRRPLARAGLFAATLALAACQTAPVVTAPSPAPAAPPVVAPAPPPLPVVPAPVPKPPRIGLALGGGAARGFAHIGVLQVLEENGIKPDLIVGTSAGSLVATLYAAGDSAAQLRSLALQMDESEITDWAYPGRALLRGEALARYVDSHTGGRTIEQMRVPLGIVATELDNGAPVLFRRGDPGLAVRASSAVPAVFEPVKIGRHEYVDGGLVSPVPVRFAREMGGQLVIAVDISSPPDGNATGDAVHMLLQTFAIMSRSINHWELRDADIVIRPKLVGVSSADFTVRAKSIEAGREAALAALPAIRARIAALTK